MRLYYITDRQALGGEEVLLGRLQQAARAGMDCIQLRERDLPAGRLEELARRAVAAVRAAGGNTRLLVNSRCDVALAAGADGVHLRSHDISAAEARELFRRAGRAAPLLAVSCHSAEDVARAAAEGASFAVFGPVFGKPGAEPQGLEALGAACAAAPGLPVLALGGVISVERARQCVQAGAAGVAGIRLFQEGDVEDMVRALQEL
jgi:thiamine-phosphate pyrophosphorylase